MTLLIPWNAILMMVIVVTILTLIGITTARYVPQMIVPNLPVQMIVLVWEHVILQQEHAHAMLDVMEMTVLWFVQTTALEREFATMIQAPIQLNVC